MPRKIPASSFHFRIGQPPDPRLNSKAVCAAYREFVKQEQNRPRPAYVQTTGAGMGVVDVPLNTNVRDKHPFADLQRIGAELREQERQAEYAVKQAREKQRQAALDERIRIEAPKAFKTFWAEYPANATKNIQYYAWCCGYVSDPMYPTGNEVVAIAKANTELNSEEYSFAYDPSGQSWARRQEIIQQNVGG